jgi:polyisoprenoid-binding protein YceI
MKGVIDNPQTNATEVLLQDGAWFIDPRHSEIGFAAKSLGGLITVRGIFDSCDGHLKARAGAVAGELTIEAATLDTGNEKRDRHLRSPDFFDVERHPRIVFVASEIVARDSDVAVAGELTIRGSRMRLELPVAVGRVGDSGLRLEGTASVSRHAAGMTWNWLGMVGDEVAVHAQLTLGRRAVTPLAAVSVTDTTEPTE